jgi:hypothetical protein
MCTRTMCYMLEYHLFCMCLFTRTYTSFVSSRLPRHPVGLALPPVPSPRLGLSSQPASGRPPRRHEPWPPFLFAVALDTPPTGYCCREETYQRPNWRLLVSGLEDKRRVRSEFRVIEERDTELECPEGLERVPPIIYRPKPTTAPAPMPVRKPCRAHGILCTLRKLSAFMDCTTSDIVGFLGRGCCCCCCSSAGFPFDSPSGPRTPGRAAPWKTS